MKRTKFFALAPALGLASILLYSVAAAQPGHGYVSVSAPAFQPESHTYQYGITSGWVRNLDGDSDYYNAPVQLPHGATLTKLVFFWKDGSAANGYCQLWRVSFSGGRGLGVASVDTTGSAGVADSSEVTITMLSTVDNSQYAYGLIVYLPDSNVEAFGAIIEYVYSVSLPLVTRNFQAQ